MLLSWLEINRVQASQIRSSSDLLIKTLDQFKEGPVAANLRINYLIIYHRCSIPARQMDPENFPQRR